jgi:hypothetical protein
MTIITAENVKKLLETVDAGLSAGLGKPVPGQMCVEAAVCFALGLPHSDDPGCVSQSVRELKIALNDSVVWSDNQSRARGLRRLAVAQLGTKGTLDEVEFARRAVMLLINKTLADFLDSQGQTEHANDCRQASDLASARKAADAVWAANAARAAANAAWAAAYAAYAAYAVAWAARAYAIWAAVADAVAKAVDAVWAADAVDAVAVAWAAKAAVAQMGQEQLAFDFAEGVVQILIDMKAPGTQWLGLTEENK